MPAMGPGMGAAATAPQRRSDGMDPNTRRAGDDRRRHRRRVRVAGRRLFAERPPGGGVPVVQADSRPLRVKPEKPAACRSPAPTTAIMSGSPTARRSGPAPEVPAPNALNARSRFPRPQPPRRPGAARARAGPVGAVPAGRRPPEPKPRRPGRAGAKATAQVPAARGPQVQLAAVGTEEGGEASGNAWKRKCRTCSAAGSRGQQDRARRQTFFRLRTSGFANASEAKGFCDGRRPRASAARWLA